MLSFALNRNFVDLYGQVEPPFGYKDAYGNSLGEIVFLDKYSRLKEDGSKEQWHEVCERVINGMYSILKNHCKENRLPWNDNKGKRSAEEAYDRLFNLKWSPPGRGLWMMGTEYVHGERRMAAALQNCAFVSTGDMTKANPEKPFLFLMEASMLGIGVGFDTLGADRGITIHNPIIGREVYVVPDTREGWVDVARFMLRGYLCGEDIPQFDYHLVREEGAPIKGFGGTAAGPGPLMELVESLNSIFKMREGQTLDSKDIADVFNLEGKCVVAGNVRRSAEIALGRYDDKQFVNLKNAAVFPERNAYPGGWAWTSNNSLLGEVGMNYDPFIDNIVANGEPGLVYMDLARNYGRMVDPINGKDYRATGTNPCGEQTLESYECCTLVETFMPRADSMEDFHRTLKFAYLYAKAVTLMPTHWPETNAVMQRNRRIGTSVSGLAQFIEHNSMNDLRTWLNHGYEVIQGWDTMYSEWLGVRESIKTTSVKPSGTVSLLAGVTPGVHWPTHGTYIRRMRMPIDAPLTVTLREAGYKIEPDVTAPERTVVVEFPIRGLGVRTEREVSVFEKANLAVIAQRWWADNQVSVTLTFDPTTEGKNIGTLLRMHEGQLKSLSLLPLFETGGAYAQMPYEQITDEQYEQFAIEGNKPIDRHLLYSTGTDAVGEQYCTTDKCEVPV
jgi:ribonucleoside-triphosphate reductase